MRALKMSSFELKFEINCSYGAVLNRTSAISLDRKTLHIVVELCSDCLAKAMNERRLKMFRLTQSPKTACMIPMSEIKPLDIGIVVQEGDYNNFVVLRTASTSKFEVMSLTAPRPDFCWTTNSPLLVRLLEPGESITLVVE